MIRLFKAFRRLESRAATLERLNNENAKRLSSIPKAVWCDGCGCAVNPARAFEGESEIRERELFEDVCGGQRYGKEKYIYTPYYCKACAPKVKV